MTPEIRHNPLNLHERLSLILSGASEPASPSLTGRQLRVCLLRQPPTAGRSHTRLCAGPLPGEPHPARATPGRTALQARGSRGSPPLRPPVTEDSHIPKGRRASSPRRSRTCPCGRPVPGDRAAPARGPSSVPGRAAACALTQGVGPSTPPRVLRAFQHPRPRSLVSLPCTTWKGSPCPPLLPLLPVAPPSTKMSQGRVLSQD
ncbi:uncharacterized protein LOC120221656 [Hyaena hyaena]|uniref:uncharacterized protein LOC120221656 n=1 Tax=Hyaena hyaena TaxID=95912 RepID=UPI0019240020|nr:uncharacterized protein LOC120221656 [Hyaena hyaena]